MRQKWLIGIDDTDNLESRGTGHRVRWLGDLLAREDLADIKGITRHQLLVDPRIPYTSHNSSTCMQISADDSTVARKEIVSVLDKLGVKYVQANDGLEAWEKLVNMANRASSERNPMKNQVQIILVDAEMPEMDGYVLTRNIKSDNRFEGIPVVMHSSLSSEANRTMGQHVGVDAYVAKFDPAVLADTLLAFLKR